MKNNWTQEELNAAKPPWWTPEELAAAKPAAFYGGFDKKSDCLRSTRALDTPAGPRAGKDPE